MAAMTLTGRADGLEVSWDRLIGSLDEVTLFPPGVQVLRIACGPSGWNSNMMTGHYLNLILRFPDVRMRDAFIADEHASR